MRLSRYLRIQGFVIGGRNNQRHTVKIRRLVITQQHLALPSAGHLTQLIANLRRNHTQGGTCITEQARLAHGNFAATDHQYQAILQFVEQGQKIHDARSRSDKQNGAALAAPSQVTEIRINR